jgi:hypothetical protein
MRRYSLKEAAAIAGVPEPVLRKAIEHEALTPEATFAGPRQVPRYHLDADDLLFLKLLADFPFALEKADKVALRALIAGPADAVGRWERQADDFVVRGPSGNLAVRLKTKRIRRDLARAIAIYERGMKRVAGDTTSPPGLFRGTDIPLASVVAAIAQGLAPAEVAARFPTLGRKDLAYAAIQAQIGRDPGRPRKLRVVGDGEAQAP